MRPRLTLRTFLAPLVLLALGTIGVSLHTAMHSTSAGAAPSGYTITGPVARIASPAAYDRPGVRFFSLTHELLHIQTPAYYVVTGTLVQRHYEYRYELDVPRDAAVAAIEVAANPGAHTQLLAVGAPTAASLAAERAAYPATGQSMPQSSQRAGSTGAPKTSSTSGYYQTTWYDPPGFVMNWVQDHANFTYDGYYVDSVTYWDAWFDQWDGWYQAQHNHGFYWGSNYTSGTVWTYALHQNNIFCVGQSTYVYYNTNNLVVHGSGGVGGYVNTWDSGGCSSWLHHDSYVSGGA